ncbi:MAG: ribosome small subunit-dependent GTPase A, partial [Candidatus Marinimicrobia bacterium]|nr:ribosome small subunit-dependent GTPase A [Candidatus Neomarinimicrobiota bacterium]
GRLQYKATSREDLPVVGDWVALMLEGEKALIRYVVERKSVLARKQAGRIFEKQLLAANVDVAFIVQALDKDFNLNRLERYMTVVYSGNILPAVLLNKYDLVTPKEAERCFKTVKKRFPEISIFLTSALYLKGIDTLRAFLKPGLTFCMVGSSGVGKSTLINAIAGEKLAETGSINCSTKKGVHITARRELHCLKNGELFIDMPGLKEIGIADAGKGLKKTFPLIYKLSEECYFDDCTHTNEPQCAVRYAVDEGILERRQYQNFLTLWKEFEHYTQQITEKSWKKR